ncbi:MAG: T9SS type A sorting domain-containing protein, partial [Taibaiella sp.]|nr:T9SS type A sorting domain-containing protein [Taibaiella sp.]
PNPFSNSTTIIYTLPGAANVTLKVYDMLGNEIVKLYDGYQNSGENRLSWNAKDIRGGDLSTGSYLCELVARPAQLAGGSSFSAFTLRSVMVLVK